MRAVLQRDLMMLAWLNARWTGFGFALIGTVVAVSASLAASPAASRDRNHRPRVASINLCTDQLLLSLADPDQIVGLSPYIRDQVRSWAAENARSYKVLSGSGEDVLVLKPDAVLAGRVTRHATRDLLRAKGVRLEEFESVRSIAAAKEQIRRVGDIVGHPERATSLIEAIDTAMARTRAVASRTALKVLSVQRRGWVAGSDSLVSSLLATTGLTNAAAELGLSAGRQLSLEVIVKAKPDLLLVTRDVGSAEDQGSALLLHPALARLYPPNRRIVVPERLTVCGGPMIAEALDRLGSELERVALQNAAIGSLRLE